jgi:hypothetical protein
MESITIADAAQKCITSFDAINQSSEFNAFKCLENEDNRSRYTIWASNLGSMHAASDKKSADYRLREAPEVTDRVLELLEELVEINSEIAEILSGTRTNRQISGSEDDSDSPDELSELHLSVGDIVTSLFKLSVLVKKATTRDRYAKAASAKDDPFLEDFDVRHVADKYPKVRTQPWLLDRLGKAITQRRQFLRYCRNHKNRIAHVSPAQFSFVARMHTHKSLRDHSRALLRHFNGECGHCKHDTWLHDFSIHALWHGHASRSRLNPQVYMSLKYTLR